MSTTADTSTDIQAIRDLLAIYERSLIESDASLAASLYAPDGIFMPLFQPIAAGNDLQAGYEQIFQAIKLEIAFTIDDLQVDGDTAHALTRSEGHVTELTSNRRGPEANRELFVFGRRDGEWRIIRYMFNKTAAPGA
jgi:uncharacterized protein (TIGR02246 family)